MSVGPANPRAECNCVSEPNHPQRILRNNSPCCFKPLGFGEISYRAVVNWNENKRGQYLGRSDSAQVRQVSMLLLGKDISSVGGERPVFDGGTEEL